MADDFGLKIGVEGEKEFKRALSDINQSFKVLGSEMQLVTSMFDKQDKSVQAVTSRNPVLNKEIDAQKEKISTLEATLKNASESFGENDRRTQNWQIQLNKAQAELNGIGKKRFGSECVTYEGVGATKKWERIKSSPGKWVENITQSVAHDILYYALSAFRCFDVVMHVHDEVIIEADKRMSLAAVCEQMSRVPLWAARLPLRCDGYETPFYKKD